MSALTTALLVVFAAIFFAVSPRSYVQGTLHLFPHDTQGDVETALGDIARALKKWLLGSLISMLAIALLMGTALALLGVPAFAALALISGIAQFVPVVGPLLAAVPGILMGLTVGPETAAWTALAYFVASQLEANLIYPVIQKRAVSLPPALTLFAIICASAATMGKNRRSANCPKWGLACTSREQMGSERGMTRPGARLSATR